MPSGSCGNRASWGGRGPGPAPLCAPRPPPRPSVSPFGSAALFPKSPCSRPRDPGALLLLLSSPRSFSLPHLTPTLLHLALCFYHPDGWQPLLDAAACPTPALPAASSP